MKTALLLEDTDSIAADIRAALEEGGWSVDSVALVKDARARARTQRYDLLVFDRMLPDGEGLGLVEDLRAEGISTPVLMLTALGNTENKTEGYRRGADDYIAKPFDNDELRARADALHRRTRGMVRTDLRIIGDLEVHATARTAHRGGDHLRLSPKEFDLLLFFVENENALVTRDMLLREVWGMNFDPGTNVVDVNVGRLRRKVDVADREPLLHTVRGVGYRFGEADAG